MVTNGGHFFMNKKRKLIKNFLKKLNVKNDKLLFVYMLFRFSLYHQNDNHKYFSNSIAQFFVETGQLIFVQSDFGLSGLER
jgi:hypothetical protein